MLTARRALLSVVVVAAVVAAVGASWSAFFSTTGSPGNTFSAGTVNIGDNDASSSMYSLSNQKPGDSVTKCIKVTYTGSLAAAVRLYASAVGPVGDYVSLTITPGTGNPTFPDCDGFTPDSTPIFNGTLRGFASTYSSFDTGLEDAPGTSSGWVTNDAVVYQFTLALQDNNLANGGATPLSTGVHSFTWEARNN